MIPGPRGSRPRVHSPIDTSCLLDAEVIEPSPFSMILRDCMGSRSIDWLSKHYPELTFAFVVAKPAARSCDYWTKRGKRYLTARWRTS